MGLNGLVGCRTTRIGICLLSIARSYPEVNDETSARHCGIARGGFRRACTAARRPWFGPNLTNRSHEPSKATCRSVLPLSSRVTPNFVSACVLGMNRARRLKNLVLNSCGGHLALNPRHSE